MVLKRNKTSNPSRRRNVRSRSNYCSTRATVVVVDKLNDDLLGEILIRLPLKTVVGLKVINKRWYSFISDPHFLYKLTSLHTNPDISTFFSHCSTSGSILRRSFHHSSPNLFSETTVSLGLPKSFARSNRDSLVLVSCHGLLVVYLQNYSDICIFNPLTKKNKFIPTPPMKRGGCRRFGLVFRPTSSSPYYHNHYNVVCLDGGMESIGFKVFNPEKGCWIDSNETTRINYSSNGLEKHSINSYSNPVCFRGIILWLSDNGVIIAFNADKDESKIIQIPSSVSEIEVTQATSWSRYLQMYRLLWLVVVEDEVNLVFCTPQNEVFIWVLEDFDENNKWKLKRKDVIKREINHPISYMKPLFFDGERLVVGHPMRSISYWQEHNIQTGISRTLCTSAGGLGFHYVSSLIEV